MRRSLVVVLALVLVLAAGSAAAQWNLGLRLVGTGNYFPYLPVIQAENSDTMPLADTGMYGYKEFIVGYRMDMLCFEASFAFDGLQSNWTDDYDNEWENDLTWWYAGGSIFRTFMQGSNYMGSAGVRYQYGASELKWSVTGDDYGGEAELTLTGNSSQISVPIRFMWMPGGGNFAIGPEVAFKYSTGTTDEERTEDGQTTSKDGPEFTGFDTEYSLLMKFMF